MCSTFLKDNADKLNQILTDLDIALCQKKYIYGKPNVQLFENPGFSPIIGR